MTPVVFPGLQSLPLYMGLLVNAARGHMAAVRACTALHALSRAHTPTAPAYFLTDVPDVAYHLTLTGKSPD